MALRIIDLTLPIYNKMMIFPSYWHPNVEISKLGNIETEGRQTTKIVFGSHTGTHVDAPLHFIPNSYSIDKLPLELLIGPAMVIDLTPCKPIQEITVENLKKSLTNKLSKRIIIRTDWSEHWEKSDYYTDYPFLSEDSVTWLVDNGLQLLALDTPSPDSPLNNRESGNDSPNHKFLLNKGVVIVEYLCNIKEITKTEVELIVLPLKIKNSDGSPARCIAIER